MIKVLTIFGTRPEAIKMSPLIIGLNDRVEFHSTVCVTAQHREMLDQVLRLFNVVPDIDLRLMRPDQDLYQLTSSVLLAIKDVISRVKPDLLLVQGDTTTTFSAAMASFYAGIPVGHVEAGLRTGDLQAPFPEEANRCLTTKLASLHFCPTQQNYDNLAKEGVDSSSIWLTGNTVIDALLWVRKRINTLSAEKWLKGEAALLTIITKNKPYILITGHRRENFGTGLKQICVAIKTLASKHKDWHFVYPVHLNPNVLKPVYELLEGQPNIHLVKPMDYGPFVLLMDRARFVLTDSGGIQEEAPSLGKPVLVMREKTERPEAVLAGTVKLIGTDAEKIRRNVEVLMTNENRYRNMSMSINPYGDGKAASRIIDAILEWKKEKESRSD